MQISAVNMKKTLIIFVIAVLLTGTLSLSAQFDDMTILDEDGFEEESFEFEEFEEDGVNDDLENLVYFDYQDIHVANPTPLYGQFFTDLFGHDTSDHDVRRLVAGYNLVTWNFEKSYFHFDRSVVSNVVVSNDRNNNRNYMIILYDDLYFSDGTPINAYSYAFSVLLQSSPLMRDLGVDPAVYDFLVGYEDYAEGRTPYLVGVQIIQDNILLLKVKEESLPYFYELARLAFYPYPIHKIAPGCAVYDDGEGAYIGNADLSVTEPVFTADLLKQTILDEETGYLSHPTPGSGPYDIISYDGKQAVFEINPFYKGNEMDKKPHIKKLTYEGGNRETMIKDLSEGTYALLNKVTYAPDILEGLQLTVNQPQFTRTTYPRIGLTYIYFNPESELVQSQAVRQAFAYGFDRDSLIRDYTGNFGLRMDCLVGLGQWTYSVLSGTMAYPVPVPEDESAASAKAYEDAIAEWEKLTFDGLTIYEFEPEKSESILIEAGWNLNEQGEPYNPEKDHIRCKMENGELHKLDMSLGYPVQGFGWDELLVKYLVEPLSEIGIKITLVPLEIGSLVDTIKQREYENLDVFYLGDDFNVSFDPDEIFRFSASLAENNASENSLPAANLELLGLAEEMDRTEPTDLLGYAQKWLKFQERFTELVPMIPVYSNVYFDFYTSEMTEYWIAENVTWADAIVATRMRTIKEINSDAVQIEANLLSSAESGIVDPLIWLENQPHPEVEEVDYSRGPIFVFPKEVQDQIPAKYNNIYEIVSGNLNKELEENDEAIEVNFGFLTPYQENETVYVLFGIQGRGDEIDWFVREGKGLADTSINVLLDREAFDQLADNTFIMVVVSE